MSSLQHSHKAFLALANMEMHKAACFKSIHVTLESKGFNESQDGLSKY